MLIIRFYILTTASYNFLKTLIMMSSFFPLPFTKPVNVFDSPKIAPAIIKGEEITVTALAMAIEPPHVFAGFYI